jgi:restriction endonuclease
MSGVAVPTEKGNALEIAVAAIERHILTRSPGLREDTFVIEGKKIIQVGGVHHEIDIFVTIDSAPGYKSVFIFECKNWTDAVGKNEIVIFAEKIDAAKAQHGYFIAKSFTRDAEAQANKDPRIILLIATEHDPTGLPVPFDFHGVIPELGSVDVCFRSWNSSNADDSPVDTTAVTAQFQGSAINLKEYLIKWAWEVCGESMRTFRSQRLPEGVYDRTAESIREFPKGELLLDGEPIKSATLHVPFKVRVFRTVTSHFEVASRGRVVTFAPVAFAGTTMEMRLVSGTTG